MERPAVRTEELWIKTLLSEGHTLVNVSKTLPKRWAFL